MGYGYRSMDCHRPGRSRGDRLARLVLTPQDRKWPRPSQLGSR